MPMVRFHHQSLYKATELLLNRTLYALNLQLDQQEECLRQRESVNRKCFNNKKRGSGKRGRRRRSINTQTESLTLKDAYSLLLKEVEIATLQSISLDTYQNIAIVLESSGGQRYEGVSKRRFEIEWWT